MLALKWKIMQNFGEQTMCVIWDVKMVDFPVCPSYRESPCLPTVQSDQEPQEPGYRSCLLVVSWWFRFALTIREFSSFSISTSLPLYSFTSSCFFFWRERVQTPTVSTTTVTSETSFSLTCYLTKQRVFWWNIHLLVLVSCLIKAKLTKIKTIKKIIYGRKTPSLETQWGSARCGKAAAKVFKNGRDHPWDATVNKPVSRLIWMLVSDWAPKYLLGPIRPGSPRMENYIFQNCSSKNHNSA